ncbi:hypothetical protein [Streptomyces sp. H27-C3]|nr:hypothetical protein [Streptomyces sp. H27-C3]MDJ0464108.1 hypothetical protein [Streptomyces sp. H27-C3]
MGMIVMDHNAHDTGSEAHGTAEHQADGGHGAHAGGGYGTMLTAFACGCR